MFHLVSALAFTVLSFAAEPRMELTCKVTWYPKDKDKIECGSATLVHDIDGEDLTFRRGVGECTTATLHFIDFGNEKDGHRWNFWVGISKRDGGAIEESTQVGFGDVLPAQLTLGANFSDGYRYYECASKRLN